MRASLIALHALAVLLAATPAAAGTRYWGLQPQTAATGVLELDGQRQSVRAGDPISTWGTVHTVDEHELVVKRPLSDDEKAALRAQGKAVYDVQHIHLRNMHGMLPRVRHAP